MIQINAALLRGAGYMGCPVAGFKLFCDVGADADQRVCLACGTHRMGEYEIEIEIQARGSYVAEERGDLYCPPAGAYVEDVEALIRMPDGTWRDFPISAEEADELAEQMIEAAEEDQRDY